jgi:ketose-bisphosphate aldolase
MPLVPFTSVLADARRGGYAVGYFEAWDVYSLEAVCEAAEAERSPVIFGFGCLLVDQQWLDGGGIEAHACLGRNVAERSRVPVALLLNEARTLPHALRGVRAGFNAVMMHLADEEQERAIPKVRELVAAAHEAGVAVEAELGSLPDAEGAEFDPSTARLTDPEEASRFVAETGVDCLAVSFGNVHVLEGRTAPVDLGRLEEIGRRVRVPLAVHGGTSFPAEAVPSAIASGVAKFNVGTSLKRAYLAGFAQRLAELSPTVDVHGAIGSHGSDDVLVAGKARVTTVVRKLMRLYGSSGRAS